MVLRAFFAELPLWVRREGWALLFMGLTVHASDALRWRWSHPEPHGNNIKALAWSAARDLWVAVGEQGALYTSRDGLLWIPRDSGTRQALRGAAFLGSRILVTGAQGTVLYADAGDDFRPGTLKDGPTVDWLEAVAAGPDVAVAVGDAGAVYSTADGVEWESRSAGVSTWLRDVAFGHGLFVAAGEEGTLLTSSDGLAWTQRNSGVNVALNRVGILDSGFLAVGEGGAARFSPDGVSWTAVATGAQGDLYVAGVSGGDVFVAGDAELRIRIDGNWTDQLSGPGSPPKETYLSSVTLPGTVFLAGRTGLMVEGVRSGLLSYQWVLRTTPDRPWLFDSVYVTNLFVAVGDQSTIMTSVDGVAWAFEFPPTNYFNRVFLGVGGTTNLLVGAGSAGSLMISPHTWAEVTSTNDSGMSTTEPVSTLGVVWHEVKTVVTSLDLQAVTYWQGHYYVGGDGGILLRTPDGTNWVTGQVPGNSFLSGLAGSAEALVGVGDSGSIYRSTDGLDWSDAADRSRTNWVYKVRYLADRFVAVGEGGLLLTSSDGRDWVQQDSGSTAWLTDAAWINGTFYVTGLGGTLLSSQDGSQWLDEGCLTLKPLFASLANEERLWVLGTEGVLLRSPVVPPEEPVAILKYTRAPSADGTRWENLYLFGGTADQQFTLNRKGEAGRGEWTAGPSLEILESGGTLLYLESVGISNTPPTEFYGTSTGGLVP